MNEPDLIHSLLSNPGTIAVVGLSDNPTRPSHSVSAYMQRQGFQIYPINPAVEEVLGQKSYPSLTALLESGVKPDIVNAFRMASFIPAIVDEMLALDLPNLWVQQGILHPEAAARAEEAGLHVVMDRCIMVEHRNLRR